MKKFYLILSITILAVINCANAASPASQRTEQFTNDKVHVWKTVVYPHAKQKLPMHRHDHDRVVVALSDGKLKIINDKGEVHYLTLQKGKAYFLSKDKPNELHSDENLGDKPVIVMVIELT